MHEWHECRRCSVSSSNLLCASSPWGNPGTKSMPPQGYLWVAKSRLRPQAFVLKGFLFPPKGCIFDSHIRETVFGSLTGVKEERRRVRRVVLGACKWLLPLFGRGATCTPASRRGQGKPERQRGSAPFERKRFIPDPQISLRTQKYEDNPSSTSAHQCFQPTSRVVAVGARQHSFYRTEYSL